MLFWLILAIFVLWVILSVIFGWDTGGMFAIAFGVASLIIMLVFIAAFHVGSPAEKVRLAEKQRALEYKLESGACRDELGLLNKEVIDEIQGWNESVSKNKILQRDFWIGIFIPNIYDDFETIDYEGFVGKDAVIDEGRLVPIKEVERED